MGECPETIEVLVVDDESPPRENMVGILQDEFLGKCVPVYSAKSGEQAIPLLRDGIVIFLDIEMGCGKLNGYDVLRHIVENGINPKAVVMTSSNAVRTDVRNKVKACYPHRRLEFLPKPFSMDHLVKTAYWAVYE